MTTKLISISLYHSTDKCDWDTFIRNSLNQSFLHFRDYIEYHRDRFNDFSLIIKYNDNIVALLPANRVGGILHSHQGLTYGGIIHGKKWNVLLALNIFEELLVFLKNNSIKRIEYRPMPYIYSSRPSQEDLYAISYFGGALEKREISSTISLSSAIRYSRGKKRGINKSKKSKLEVIESNNVKQFYKILEYQLNKDYNKRPVHTLSELELLKLRFSGNIRVFCVLLDGDVIAGTVIYENPTVAHAQYISSSDVGKNIHALDYLFDYLIKNIYKTKLYFDFGISTENSGKYLNKGLSQFKEGFGASGVCYDTYCLDIK